MLAGWLFADLALGLVVILLGTATDAPIEPITGPATSASASPSPSGSSSPPGRIGVEQQPLKLAMHTDADALIRRDQREVARLSEAIRQALEPHMATGRTAAFVLTFGGSRVPGEGVSVAKAANEVLRQAEPSLMAPAASSDFWQSIGSDGIERGTVSFKIYLFMQG